MRRLTTILILTLLTVAAAGRADEPGSRELMPGLFLVEGLGEAGNVAFLTTPEGVVVVDSGESPEHGRQILEAVRARTGAPVRYLVLTHVHSDHTFGAQVFPVTTLVFGQRGLGVALERERAYLLGAYPPYLEKARAGIERSRAAGDSGLGEAQARLERDLAAYETVKSLSLREPQFEIEGHLEVRIGGQVLEVRSAPRTHTGDSVVVRFPGLRAAHFGDLLFAGAHAFVDARVGADTGHWIEVLEEARGWDLEVVIPGHGPVGGKGLLDDQIGYLRALRREVAAAIAAGQTLEQATEGVAAAMRRAYPGYAFEDGLGYGIPAVWSELRREALGSS